jgi:hypothetical protein
VSVGAPCFSRGSDASASRKESPVYRSGFRVCVTTLSKFSPGGTAECSPGRQSWVHKTEGSVPQGRLKMPQDAILGFLYL